MAAHGGINGPTSTGAHRSSPALIDEVTEVTTRWVGAGPSAGPSEASTRTRVVRPNPASSPGPRVPAVGGGGERRRLFSVAEIEAALVPTARPVPVDDEFRSGMRAALRLSGVVLAVLVGGVVGVSRSPLAGAVVAVAVLGVVGVGVPAVLNRS